LRVTTTSTRAVPPASPDVAVGTPDLSLWGSGTALRIDLPAPWPDHVHLVAEALSSMRQKSGDGTEGLPVRGPVAFGALPFDRELPASFVVPVRLVGRTARGDSWTTVVDGADLAATRTAADLPSDVQVRAVQDPEDWCDAVAAATKAIAEGDFTKVVLARELLVEAGTAFDPAAVLARFVQAHPHALTGRHIHAHHRALLGRAHSHRTVGCLHCRRAGA
jgi:isochorismate synthase EntC